MGYTPSYSPAAKNLAQVRPGAHRPLQGQEPPTKPGQVDPGNLAAMHFPSGKLH